MKKIFLLLFTLLLTINIASAKTYTVGKDVSELEVNKGDKIIIELAENPTTGYIWKLASNEETVLLEQSKKFITANTNMEGVPGILRYTYKAINTGTAKIDGFYARPWEKTAKAASRYILTVKVK